MLCFVGRGDSTKSTILEAIRRLFHPQWNLTFDDADFHGCQPTDELKIEAVATDFPEEFRDLARYGHWLCGWSAAEGRRKSDPAEDAEDALRIRLFVGRDLEPHWTIVKEDDDEGVAFKPTDRAKAAVSLIGAMSDRHLTWGKGSILAQLTEAENITSSLADAARAAKAALEVRRSQDLGPFDAVAKRAEVTAKSLGVVVASAYKAHLDTDALDIHVGGLALHDGDMPLRQLGLGSRRMLTTGLQKQALREPHITLCDEVEIALEPHRVARLVHHLKEDKTGQYFLTTHSPVVLRELTVDDLQIVHCRNGKTEVIAANKPAITDSIQGNIRQGAEAFLAPKIVVCEGATEVGFLRGLDAYWIGRQMKSFAYQGVALFDANGAGKVRAIAEGLTELQYAVGVLVDSDDKTQFSPSDTSALRAKGINVTMWEGDLSIEERVIADLPWDGVLASFECARGIHGNEDRLLHQVQSQYGKGFNRDFSAWTDSATLRSAIGKAAKASDWYKRQSWAAVWVESISGFFGDSSIQTTDLIKQLAAVRAWIDRA